MADQDYTQDKGFMAASPEDQHAYLMQADQGYAKASPGDQKAYLAHLRSQGGGSQNPASQTGAFQTKKGGQIYTDAMKYANDQKEGEKAAAAGTEAVLGGSQPGGEATVGAVKGAMSTGRNIGGLAIRALKYLKPDWGEKAAAAWPEAVNGPSEVMKPQSFPAKAGFAGEQGAEFFAPAGEVAKGAQLADAAIDSMKIAPLAAKSLKLMSRAGLEGAAAGGVTAAQGGDVGINAAIGAATPLAAAALKPVATAAAEKVAPALANRLLRPVPTQLENAARFGRNPGQAIADEGIVATSHGDLVNRIADRKQDVGDQIGSMLKSATGAKPIDAGAIVNKNIDAAIKDVLDGKMEGGQALVDRLEEMRSQLTQQRQLVNGKVQNVSAKNLSLSPADAHTLKRQVGDSAKWTGQAFDGEVNQVKRGIYRDLNEQIQKAVPDVKALQDRYGNLLEAEKAAEREDARHSARNPFSLLDAAAGATGAAMGASHGPEGSILGGLALPAARHAVQSPLAQTSAVQALKNLPRMVTPEFLRSLRNAAFGAQSESRQQ